MSTAHTATPTPMVIESIDQNGAEWGVSFDGPNPEVDRYVKCASKEEAYKIARAVIAHDDLVKVAQGAYQQTWNPDSFGGYSEEQLALIRVGFNHAMNGVYAAVKPALAAAEPH